MKTKRQIALNKLFNVGIILGAFLVWVAIDGLYYDEDRGLAIGIGVVGMLFIVIPAVFVPYCYVFDKDGVSIRYLFLTKERYLWKDVYAIDVSYSSVGNSSGFDLFFGTFVIHGDNVGEYRFYMDGHVRKSFRTKRLLEKYWDGTITGYLFEDIDKWLKKRRQKKKAEAKRHLTDEIVPMERDARTAARKALIPYLAKAKELELETKTRFVYVTDSLDESNSRPKEGYTYTLIIELSLCGETNENRIVSISVDLVKVRLGKYFYRGVMNKHLEEELNVTLADALEEIEKNGIEAYCSEL